MRVASTLGVGACFAVFAWRVSDAEREADLGAPAAAAALLAATPISFVYDDGCNDHSTISPAATAPFIALTHPQEPVPSYSDASTRVACSTRR